MPDLADLMALPGAQAAFEMNDRGELQDHLIGPRATLTETSLDLLAHMCIANIAIATMQARGWEANADTKGFYPVNGFTLIGLDWSAITDGRRGVVLYNGVADYEAAYALLARMEGAG
jgi:roadblock/LC7 domain-containing protein